MTSAMIEGLALVLATVAAVFALGWHAATEYAARRAAAERPVPCRMTLLGCMQTSPHYGRMAGTVPFQGAQDPQFEMALGEYDRREAEVNAEVDQIWRVITGDPGWSRWAEPLRDRL